MNPLICNAGAILTTFGVSGAAIVDIISGKFKKTGKLTYAPANKARQSSTNDRTFRDTRLNTLFPFGHGLTFSTPCG